MKVESVKHFKKLVADFRLLTTKIQKDYQIKSKNLKETNQVLEACKKISKTLSWTWSFTKKVQDELLKCQKQLKNWPVSNTKKQDKKINLNDIEFDKNKLTKL